MKITRVITILLLTAVLLAFLPAGSVEQVAQDKVEQTVIYSQSPFDVRLAKRNSEYRIVGIFVGCNSLYDVRGVLVGNPSDSTAVQGVPVMRDYAKADSCTVEIFAFGIHAGALRKVVEADGLAEVIVMCANGVIRFVFTAEGEQQLIEFLKVKQDSI